MKQKNTSHEFALFVADLGVCHKIISISDKDVIHRIMHVLRLKQDDILIVFDDQHVFRVSIATITKTVITCTVQEVIQIVLPQPKITALIPILKKEALEQALYAAVELGVTHVVLTKIAKSYSLSLSPAYMQRLQSIIHAAQEQAKQYAPIIFEGPVSLEKALTSLKGDMVKIVALQGGTSLMKQKLEKNKEIVLTVGPEADFTEEEKELLHAQGFVGCSLGFTVLRAQQALTVLIGAVRSLTV